MELERINNIKVNPVESVEKYKRKKGRKSVVGYEFFQEPFCNIFICAKKNSGKTTLIFNMIQHLLISKSEQVVYFFVGTISKDLIYEKIIDMLKYNEIEYHCYDSIIDDERINILDAVLDNIKEVDKENFDYPENIFIFDDISFDLDNKSVSKLVKSNRHYKSKVILSSQYITDLTTSSRLNLDYVIVFRNISKDNLKVLHKSINVQQDYDEFYKIYKTAIDYDKHSFLYIDLARQEYRINFDLKFKNVNTSYNSDSDNSIESE